MASVGVGGRTQTRPNKTNPTHPASPLSNQRAFYEAGAAWRAACRPSAAFVFLNHYLDIADAVDEALDGGAAAGGSSGMVEGSDLAGTGIPRDAPLPARHYCDAAAREEVRGSAVAAAAAWGPFVSKVALQTCLKQRGFQPSETAKPPRPTRRGTTSLSCRWTAASSSGWWRGRATAAAPTPLRAA